MEIELKQIVGYLPYEMGFVNIYNGMYLTMNGLNEEKIFNYGQGSFYFTDIKPILRPVSDLKDEDTIVFYGLSSLDLELIEINEWTEELIHELKSNQKFQLSQFEYLYSKLFDIHGLIEKGVAIDINAFNN